MISCMLKKSSTRSASIPSPPDSTVNWDSRNNESGLAPVSQHPITTRRVKSQQGTSPNFVPCSTPRESQ